MGKENEKNLVESTLRGFWVPGAGFKVMTLDQQYEGMPVGVFTGEFEEDMGDYVVYPYGDHFIDENGQLVYVLPSSYTYTSIEEDANSFNPPMVGRIGEGQAMLAHVGSFFRISVDNIPQVEKI